MSVQIFAKLVTTSLNFVVARIVNKEVYGYAHIQLFLFHTFILFYSKEAVRKACQREVKVEGKDDKENKLA